MIKVKKSLALLIAIFLIFSNVAFAQYSDPGYYEDRQINPSKESKEYSREDSVIVYPAKMGSEEKRMMQRFMKGDISEEEMRRMAKEKLGDKFDEMEFKRRMIELKERMMRKDVFSYEHEGYEQRYYINPSYEGYSKEHMVFGMIFQHIGDDIDPREIKQYCNDPEKIADIAINKLKENIGDLQNICNKAEEGEAKCQEYAKKSCYQLGTPYVREDATELEKIQSIAFSCPVNKDAIIKACVLRSKSNIEQNIKHATESCEKITGYEGERLLRECERFKQNQICDKEKYVERCMGGIKKDDFERKCDKELCKHYICCDSLKAVCPLGFPQQCSECTKDICERECPQTATPDCREGAVLHKKIDDKGCFSYYCETAQTTRECTTEECGPQLGMPNYLCQDGKTNAGPTGRCLRHADGKCGWEVISCPINAKTCAQENQFCGGIAGINCCSELTCKLEGNYPDAGGVCVRGSVCQKDVKQCPDGSYVVRVAPNCEFRQCPTSTIKCPEPVQVTCKERQILQKKSDDKGCVYYYCEAFQCPEISKPTCNADETLQAYYDNAGCVTSYQCVHTCPQLSPPSPDFCPNGAITTKYDDKRCIVGYECISVTTTSNVVKITGNAVIGTYDDRLRHCQNSWEQQEMACASMLESCDKDAMIERCKQQSRKTYEDHLSKTKQNCAIYSHTEIMAAEDRCLRIDKERERCFEESTRRCEHMTGVAQKCRETLTEENLRKFIVEEAKKRCKFTDIVTDEDDIRKSDKVEIILAVLNTATEKDIEKLELFIDGLEEDLKLQDTTVYKGMINPNNFGDIKLLPFVVNAKISAERAKEVKAKIVARQEAEEAASKLISLRDSDVPSEYLYIIEDKASDILNVSDELKNVEKKEEQKGVGYKIRLFLGFAKKSEEVEINQLGESKNKLKNSIEVLTKLIDEVPSDVAKAILKEQVENLKNQQADIEVLIETKAKKAKGLFGVFG